MPTNEGAEPPEPSTPSPVDRRVVIDSWFLGPKAENLAILAEAWNIILCKVDTGRKTYFPNDPIGIAEEVRENKQVGSSHSRLIHELGYLADRLSYSAAPFFSPRYAAHMTSDTTLAGTLGYILGILYNQNNVAPEGGPFTTLLEYIVGQQLCIMLGFQQSIGPQNPEPPADTPQKGVDPWGHLTSGGSISNLEAMWVGMSSLNYKSTPILLTRVLARNLKYYPLSLKCAMKEGNPLDFASSLNVNLCDGTSTQFGECEAWQLLNLAPTEILDLPSRLHSEFKVLPETLERILKDYNIQSVGKAWLDDHFGITEPSQFLVSCVSHYSMAKSTAILGIGCKNVTEIKVDFDARMDTEHLREVLDECLQNKRAVLAVIVIAGSTEHGAVDPISKILAIREEFQKKGLSFMIHADAAWGGYFRTLIPDSNPSPADNNTPDPPYVLRLNCHTKEELLALCNVDSVTVDPHKSGYIPYPAGAICYKDGRLRYLVTWKSPVLNIGEIDTSVGIYGIAGSKPGAAALAVYLSHAVINLDMTGYGTLLGTALFTGVKMYMRLVTMTFRHEDLMVVPFKMLKSEKEEPSNFNKIKEEKDKIIKWLSQSNEQLEGDKKEIAELGSDLVINPFACNFYIDGKPNQDVVESNFLNDVLYRRLSIRSVKDDIKKIPIILYSTKFSQKIYGLPLIKFRERLGLYPWDREDVVALSNTSMFPFHTSNDLLKTIMDDFRETAEKEVESIIKYRYPRWRRYPCIHAFLMQGTDTVHLVHFPVFNVANHRKQVIATAKLSQEVMEKYKAAFKQDPKEPLCIFIKSRETLEETLKRGSFVGDVYHGSPFRYLDDDFKPIIEGVEVTNLKPIKVRSLSRFDLPKDYPVKMPFYLYGTRKEQHIDHVLLRAPNVQLSGTQVKLELSLSLKNRRMEKGLKEGLIAILEGVPERVMQPIGERNPPEFFSAGKSFKVKIYEDPNLCSGISHLESSVSESPKSWDNGRDGDLSMFGMEQDVDGVKEFILPRLLTEGRLTLSNAVWHDYKNLNRDIGLAEEVPGHCPTYPIFQMRGEEDWMKAFKEESKRNAVLPEKPLLGGDVSSSSEANPGYGKDMDVIKELQARLHLPLRDG